MGTLSIYSLDNTLILCQSKYPKTGDCIHLITNDDLNLCKRSNAFLCAEDQYKDWFRISHSARETFINCRQAFYFRYICGIKIKNQHISNSIKLGKIWDEFVEYKIKKKKFKPRFDELVVSLDIPPIEQAKLIAVFKAFKDLNIRVDNTGQTQAKFWFPSSYNEKTVVYGLLDVAYTDHFDEYKYSGSNFYLSPYNIAHQIGTYFKANDKYKWCNMMITKAPQLRLNKDEKKIGEGDRYSVFSNRVYKEIITYPSKYFLGYKRNDNNTAKYGLKYFRGEFQPLDELLVDYNRVSFEIKRAIEEHDNGIEGVFWQEKKSCQRFGPDYPCDYLPICTSRVVDEQRYEIRFHKMKQPQ